MTPAELRQWKAQWREAAHAYTVNPTQENEDKLNEAWVVLARAGVLKGEIVEDEETVV